MQFDINCLKPGMVLIKITVQNCHTIEKVSKVVGPNFSLIYNQTVLLPSQTVGFYNLTPGCLVFAVSSNNQEQINYYKNMSPNDDFISRISGTHVVSREKEAIRLRDIRMDKMELRSKAFARKLCSNQIDDIPLPKKDTFKLKYVAPKEYCSAPLPVFWIPKSTPSTEFIQQIQQNKTTPDITSNAEIAI